MRREWLRARLSHRWKAIGIGEEVRELAAWENHWDRRL
jgi:hypothetical protein